jgi:glycosyltransferase involved in cell wall biosynthesis
MKKILIISYFFEPTNFVGAERINAWVKYLPDSEIYPIVLTRHWQENQTTLNKLKDFRKAQISKTDRYEIHRVPEKWKLRDRLIETNKFIYLRKVFTFFQLLCDLLLFRKSQYYFLYRQAEKVLSQNQDLDTVIISGTPFHSFAIGYYLKLKFSRISWIPDYRDQWNTHPYADKSTILRKFIVFLEEKKEKQWTLNASKFITVSENWKDRISSFIGKEGFVIKNGFDFNPLEINPLKIPRQQNKLVISYIGTLYPYQNIGLLLNVVKNLIIESQLNIHLNFVGINSLENQEKKIKEQYSDILVNMTFYDRMPPKDLQKIYDQSDLLWLTSFENMIGWYPVKLFDYAKQGIPLVFFPSDEDVIEEFIKTTKVGYFFSEIDKVKEFLIELLNSNSKIATFHNRSELIKFTRAFSTRELAKKFLETKL